MHRQMKAASTSRPTASLTPRARLEAAMRAPRIAIEHIAPQVDGARYMVKGIVGQALRIEADVFMDGHAQLAVQVLWQEANGKPVSHAMEAFGNDRWRTSVTPLRPVRHSYTIEARLDVWATYTVG